MNKIAVFIGTTNGPVRIERISNEPAPLTEVCKGRDFQPLQPISDDYENFVRPGRPVEQAFGPFAHTSFRMDVSDEINSGQSWRLAVFVAHGLLKGDRLARADEDVAGVVWLTGRINADFQVEPVGHIAEKIHASKDLFDECLKNGKKVSVYLPEEDSRLPDGATPDGVAVHCVSDVFRVLHDLEIEHNSITDTTSLLVMDAQTSAQDMPRSNYMRTAIPLIALLGISTFVGLHFVEQNDQDTMPTNTNLSRLDEVKAQGSDPLSQKDNSRAVPLDTNSSQEPSIKVFARSAPKGGTCAQVQFGDKRADRILIGDHVSGISPSDSLGNVCGLGFEFLGDGGEREFVARLEVLSGGYVDQKSKIKEYRFRGKGGFDIDLPRILETDFHYKITLEATASSGLKPIEVSHRYSH